MKLLFIEHEESLSKLETALTKLKTTTVEIGLPEGASSRSRWLLALHQRGSPIMRIPPRPVVAPALAQSEVQQAIAAGRTRLCAFCAKRDDIDTSNLLTEDKKVTDEDLADYGDADTEADTAAAEN